MSAPVVWVNKYLGNTWHVLRRLRRDRRRGEFTLLHTHPNPRDRGRFHCDRFIREPDDLNAKQYVEYCLDFAKRHRVSLFVVGRKLPDIVRARKKFEAIGTKLLAAGGTTTLKTLNHKGRLYESLAGFGIPLPDFAVVNDLLGFDTAWKAMRDRHRLLCFKPAVGVFGIGFRVVIDRRIPKDCDIARELRISLDEARKQFGNRKRFRDLMLMAYLPGPERSVDCLADNGTLLRCVVRRKERGRQVVEHNPKLALQVARLAEKFKLTAVFNAQFRDVDRVPHLLEINPRTAGGLVISNASGVNFLLWAIRLALGTATPEDIPHPRTGWHIPQPRRVPSR